MSDPIKETLKIDKQLLGEVISREELRQVQLEMLNLLVDACDAHGLTYYLGGGTLLGAVRHKGFIPWDDDIDVCMQRSELDRLLELTGGRLNDHTVIAAPGGVFPTYNTFPRVYDTRYIVIFNSSDPEITYYTNLFIDVFQIDGLPTNRKLERLHYRLGEILISIRGVAFYPVPRSISKSHLVGKHLFRPIAKLMGVDFWVRMLQNLAKRYRYEDCDYVGVVVPCKYAMKERMRRDGYGTPVKVEFEGRLYSAPADWDTYLTNHYGDYMKLPPEEERKSHSLIICRVKDAQS